MNKVLNFVKKYKKSFIFGGLAILLIGFFVLGGGETKSTSYTVVRGDIEESVVLSGKVESSDQADLGFASSGRVNRIFVKNNQNVKQGQILAQLEIGDLLADLRIKELNSRTSTVDLEAAKEEVQNVTAEENTKVRNALRVLLSDDLELVANSSTYDVEAPDVLGAFTGSPGEYKVRIVKESSNDLTPTLFTFNLETNKRIINKTGSTPLGTKGLYLSFSEDLDLYNDTTWTLSIPNKAGANYTENLNAYNAAIEARDLAIKAAQADLDRLMTEEGGGDSVAAAEIQKINAEIRKNTIYAPFAGIVTNIEREVGENVSVGDRMISILGESKLEVVLEVSELDVAKLVPGADIEITIDAIRGESFAGVLKTVNSRETEIQGVPVYEAFVELETDPRIKTGMNANGKVVLGEKENVITIPYYAVQNESGKAFVEVMLSSGDTERREVVLGLRGTDSIVEVIAGLTEGEEIVFTPQTK